MNCRIPRRPCRFGVELFLLKDGTVLLNEVAPRVHNSGHYTMDACHTDQCALQPTGTQEPSPELPRCFRRRVLRAGLACTMLLQD